MRSFSHFITISISSDVRNDANDTNTQKIIIARFNISLNDVTTHVRKKLTKCYQENNVSFGIIIACSIMIYRQFVWIKWALLVKITQFFLFSDQRLNCSVGNISSIFFILFLRSISAQRIIKHCFNINHVSTINGRIIFSLPVKVLMSAFINMRKLAKKGFVELYFIIFKGAIISVEKCIQCNSM